MSHVDKSLQDKIKRGEYVDLSKQLIKQRNSDDSSMQLINRDGRTLWVPAVDKDLPVINSFRKWEQAFQVYSCIYTLAHPDRAHEIFQYMDTIAHAAYSFIWDNVYQYDQTFRHLIVMFPKCSWAVIYTHGWNHITALNPCNMNNNGNGHNRGYNNGSNSNSHGSNKSKDICLKYNNSKCTYGNNCRFEHRCVICHKPGHTKGNCKKRSRKEGEKQK